ncbi:MAG: efflux RND transporter permease subunit, partial [Campylobacterota bacterium]|nr:efflux RND transporter permease subunit [Campylobacterota bacterium]
RPITTLMGVLTFIVFGLMSYKTMPINLFPNVDFPVVTIQTVYNGADASTVETKVTDKIEEVVSGIDGIDKLFSTSYEGFSVVTIQFELFKDLDVATNDVRDKIGTLILPDGVEKSTVKKLGASGVVINLFVASQSGNPIELMRMSDEKLKPKLQRIKGVGEVNIIGYQDREIRIFVDPTKLNKYDITIRELQSKIQANNISQGAGKLINNDEEVVLKVKADALSIEQLKNITIKSGVKLLDIATVEDSLSDTNSFSTFEGKQGVMLEIKKISGENVLEIIEKVKEIIPSLEATAGDEYQLQLLQDQSTKIMVNIDNVTFDLIYGSILAIIIVFAFLRNVTATLVSALAIPTSIIGTFAIIDYMGYDLNRLTLIGLTLAIGIFIDDAIVVIENITKKLEKGVEPFRASFEGIKEVAFSILAISSVLLAVFIPVAFMDGIVGMFFNSFAMTVAAGIVISYLVAVMFIPTVGARVLSGSESKLWHITEPYFLKLDQVYVKILKFLLRFKVLTIVVTVALLIASTKLTVGMSFIPMEDNSEMQIFIKAPVGSSLFDMKNKMQPIMDKIKQDQNVEYSVLSIGYNAAKELHKAKVYVKLKTKEFRSLSQEDIIQNYTNDFKGTKMTDMVITVEDLPPFDTGSSNAPVQVVITGDSLDKLDELSQTFMAKLNEIPSLTNIDRDFESGKPEYKINILRENTTRVGVEASDIANILAAAYSSDRAISYYEENGREFDITLRFKDQFRKSIDDIKKLHVRNISGELVSLDGLVTVTKSVGNASINRFDRERKVLVTTGLYGESLDSVVLKMDNILKEILPAGYTYRYTGDIENMKKTGAAFGGAILLAIILIYLILAALYESLLQPFIIMVSMPLSFTGVMVALYLTGNDFSLFVMIGIILLLGMVGKNAILVVDFANQAIKEGKSVDDAVLEAGEKRLRPILMTTFAMIGAMLPLAFGTGAGSESNAPMALAIVGGLVSSTVLTLLVVPAIYKFIYPLDAWLRKFY